MRTTFKILISVLGIFIGFHGTPASAKIPQIGGSNYGIITAGSFIEKQTEESWYSPQGVHSVVGNFHRFPELSKKQLQTLSENGQQKISLMLWTVPSNAPVENEFGHTLKISAPGMLHPQHATNLKTLLLEIARLKFKTVFIRFANQGGCDPSGWSQWNESQFIENYRFAASTRQLVEETLKNSGLEIIYDLAGEQPGGLGFAKAYVQKMWSQWVRQFGAARTVAFSIAWTPGRLQNLIRDLKAANGQLPSHYALDIYGGERQACAQALRELRAMGEDKKPIVIMESYYNDTSAARDFAYAQEVLGLNIVSVLQWPLARGTNKKHFSRDLPDSYSEYLKISQ